ncbi:MAG: serine/threonine protein kinase [Myxococcaceae bacterium]|nr:serine/threonine protein kinase [Myxococcaceae bacterium]
MPPSAFWSPQQHISGITLVRKLGQGGMAELWLGVDDGRRVAVKRLLPDLVGESEVQALFLDEMRVTRELNHPNICRVLKLGHEGPVPWLELELLAGDPASAILQRAGAANVRWPVPLVASVLRSVARALAYAHGLALQVVHRDVSPNNVFICWDGGVKVLDFGIAHAVGRTVRTRTGEFRGSMSYASPEQVRGEKVDPRADQFSLGAVAFELLTGKKLHAKKSAFQVMAALTESVEPFPRVDAVSPLVHPKLADVVARLLERDPARRFASMADVAAALTAWLDETCDAASCDAAALSAFVHTLCAARIAEQAAQYEGA